MAARELESSARAVALYQAGQSVRAAAAAAGISPATLHRALSRRGIEKRGPLKGAAHHAYIDGRSAQRRLLSLGVGPGDLSGADQRK